MAEGVYLELRKNGEITDEVKDDTEQSSGYRKKKIFDLHRYDSHKKPLQYLFHITSYSSFFVLFMVLSTLFCKIFVVLH